eukprot:SAG31_NODE_42652_length_270_cov_1.116959_1_plen_43_part_01
MVFIDLYYRSAAVSSSLVFQWVLGLFGLRRVLAELLSHFVLKF